MNAYVQECWETALALLQPTKAELERGLAIHREALVIDVYGFAPRACIDGPALAAAAEAGASARELQDLREDMMMTRWATEPAEREEFLAAFDFAGVNCVVQNAGEESQSVSRLLRRLAHFTFATDVARDVVIRAAFPEDIVAAWEQGKPCLYLAANGVPLAERWETAEEELSFVRVFFQLGIRMMHLTYNRRNMIGDGCAEQSNAGLSDFGRAVVAEMNRQGVIVDGAHSSWQTCLDAARVSTKPIVASHTACAVLHPHHRNKPAEVIRAICDTEGLVGVCFVPAFLGGEGTIITLLEHIDYIARHFGVDYVGVGSDAAYVPPRMAAEEAKLPCLKQRRGWHNFWPPDDPLFDPRFHKPEQRQSLAWTNWPLVTVGLVQRGYTEAQIRKILGENMLRVAKAAVSDQPRAG